MKFVLDCSVTMAWFLEDEATAYTEHLQDALAEGSEAFVPSIWPFEVVNVFLVAERRNRIAPERTDLLLNQLRILPIRVQPAPSVHRMKELTVIAREYGLTGYNTAYLELARREHLPLATLDKDLSQCAGASGVSLVQIDGIVE